VDQKPADRFGQTVLTSDLTAARLRERMVSHLEWASLQREHDTLMSGGLGGDRSASLINRIERVLGSRPSVGEDAEWVETFAGLAGVLGS
jgi:hypothetical protein